MNIFESILTAIASLRANKLRSGLTILGVIIGVAATITMIAVGEGAKHQVTQSIKNLGTNLLIISPGQPGRGFGMARGQFKELKLEDAESIKEKISEVLEVSPEVRRNLTVEFENINTTTLVIGAMQSFLKVRNYQLGAGENFSNEEIKGKKKVCILGSEVAKNLFGEYNPIGKIIKISRHNFKVIGVLKEKGSQMMGNPDDVVFIPLTTAQRRIFGRQDISTIYVEVKSEDLMEKAHEKIVDLMRERHNLKEKDEDDFTVRSQKDMLQTMQGVVGTFTALLASIAVVSLIVGGIGIMNIMLVSVVERTREIGIRKAVGATPHNIMNQFIVEAVVLSLTGGAIGIVVGIVVTKIIAISAGWMVIITGRSILLAFLFSFSVGVFFGYYPSKKAAKLNPIDALRYE